MNGVSRVNELLEMLDLPKGDQVVKLYQFGVRDICTGGTLSWWEDGTFGKLLKVWRDDEKSIIDQGRKAIQELFEDDITKGKVSKILG